VWKEGDNEGDKTRTTSSCGAKKIFAELRASMEDFLQQDWNPPAF